MEKEKRYAVLIDADNVSYDHFKTVFDMITNEGIVTYRRIYGDWTDQRLQVYKNHIIKYSLNPIQQFANTKGKNATDSAMIIDAMDILYQDNVDGFCIVSSDSDFTRLASRLRESGKQVIGMGEKKTPGSFRDACDRFFDLDLENTALPDEPAYVAAPEQSTDTKQQSAKPSEKAAKKPESKKPTLTKEENELRRMIVKIIDENTEDGGYMLASHLGGLIQRKKPDFSAKKYGCKKFSELLEKLGLKVKKEIDPHNKENPNGLEVFVAVE